MTRKTKMTQGPFKEVIESPTQNGGVYTVYYYFDNRYKPAEKSRATRTIMHEYDEKERSVFRGYYSVSNGRVLPNTEIKEVE